MTVEPLTSSNDPDWLGLRVALWPVCTVDEHRREMALFAAAPERYAQFIARSDERDAVGFVETSIRTEYVNGTATTPVAFLEGLYVVPGARRQGVASLLVRTVAAWAKRMGCSELASDTQLDNTVSQAVHVALGFDETERVVYYNMILGPEHAG
jgi:aminoglycoside 6'-N-acetyltransferase I